MKNRRLNSASRSNNNQHALLNKLPVEMIDVSSGGIGVKTNVVLDKRKLCIGEIVTVVFELCRAKIVYKFVVKNIDKERIGLQYVDKRNLTPQQRVSMYHQTGGKKE